MRVRKHIKKLFYETGSLVGCFLMIICYQENMHRMHAAFFVSLHYLVLSHKRSQKAPFCVKKNMSFYEENRSAQNAFYKSRQWKKCRKAYISEHPLCERCLKMGIATPGEHVHHIIELDESNYKNPMIALNPDNLETLCFECHKQEHNPTNTGKPVTDKGFAFDSDGNLIKYKKDFNL